MQDKKKYNIALIGAGRMGARWAKTIATSKCSSLSLVVDTNEALAKKVAVLHGVASCTDHTEAFHDGIDAVCIVTPHKFLYPLAKEALLAGKHVFLEKPGARSAEEMQDLLRISREKKLALTVGFNYRFFDSFQQAKKIVERGDIGEIHSVRIVHGHPGRIGYEKEWRMNKELAGGGVLMDQGLHCVDLARWFLGDKVHEVKGIIGNVMWKAEVEDYASVLLTTARGKSATLTVSISEWKPVFSCHIGGEKGYISIQGLGRKYGTGGSFFVGRYNREKEILEEEVVACDPDADKALSREFDMFLDEMRKGPSGNLTAEDAKEVLAIIETVYTQTKKSV